MRKISTGGDGVGRGVFEAQGTAWPGTGAESIGPARNAGTARGPVSPPAAHLGAREREAAAQGPAPQHTRLAEAPVYLAPQVILTGNRREGQTGRWALETGDFRMES